MNVEIGQLWEAATVLLALQATSFGWRINRESAAAEKDEPTWLLVADIINILAMCISVSCVFLAPILGFWSTGGARSFGLVLILTVGHAVSLAAHYELFNVGRRSNAYFPLQEKFAVCATLTVALVYLLVTDALNHCEPANDSGSSQKPSKSVLVTSGTWARSAHVLLLRTVSSAAMVSRSTTRV